MILPIRSDKDYHVWWTNFIVKSIDQNLYLRGSEDYVNAVLSHWNAAIKRRGDKVFVEFKSESDATLFILRWS